MNALLTRCRHIRVNWLDTHSCTCLECGKTGHWFEMERMVMWTQSRKIDKVKPLLPTNLPLQTNIDSFSAAASRAG